MFTENIAKCMYT